jgi:3D (Asp-Asp-Asp) domain-containing protein
MRKVCAFILFICLIFCNWQLAVAESELEVMLDKLQEETAKVLTVEEELQRLNKELDLANTTISDLRDKGFKLLYLGEFKLTHYCTEKRKHICGTGDGITATGTQVTAGRSIAVDPKVIPYGTQVYIEGYGFRIAEDCGGAIKRQHIDIAVDTHDEAMKMGVKNGGVWILVDTPY